MEWQKLPRRIPEEKVFAARKLSKEVTALTIAKVIQRDHRKIKRYATTSQQRHRKRVQLQLCIGKLNDRHLR